MGKVTKEVHVIHHYEKPKPKIRYRKPKKKKVPIKKIINISADIIELIIKVI